jgi:hypothetical protein
VTRSYVFLALVLAFGCSERDKPQVKREPERPRRVIEPPSRGVRALPPHAIRPDGVGPYKLGAPAAELLEQLPSGPRIRQFTIPGIVHRDMLRDEDDAILIGAEPQGKATFVAVVRGEIARTESGIQVGSTRQQLTEALGPPIEELERARDPRLVVPTKLDNAHMVFDGDRISAIVLTPAVERTKEQPASTEGKDHKDPCVRPASDRAQDTVGACLSNGGELVRAGSDEIAVLPRDSDKVIARAAVPGLVFAAPLRQVGETRDDLVAIVKSANEQDVTWSFLLFRMIDGKLIRVNEPRPLYQLTAAHARWIGADLDDLDLFIELTSKPEAIEAGGFLTTRVRSQIRDLVVVSPISVPRRGSKPATAEPATPAVPPEDAQGSGSPERPTR